MDASGLSRSLRVRHPNTPQPEEPSREIPHAVPPSASTRRKQQELLDDLYEGFEALMPVRSSPVRTKSSPNCASKGYKQGMTVAKMCQALREGSTQRYGIRNMSSSKPAPPRYVEDILDDPQARKWHLTGPEIAAYIWRKERPMARYLRRKSTQPRADKVHYVFAHLFQAKFAASAFIHSGPYIQAMYTDLVFSSSYTDERSLLGRAI
ncbi:hypothetical protein QFC24_003204 [Naganishia onofrii]|uniref:Uncharacterized protein n=1 Tax=Naganishia onofrii TaxID=1851511 RepID=A0ACC2XKD0_9TREE|nr:hypothetical protein QFC24_003204 [Naganishia onofrii]